MTTVAAGMLLLATPSLLDPNFSDSVVLIVDAAEEGALGLVLNRPSQVPVAEVLGPWAEVVDEPDSLFVGGPVRPEAALAVAQLRPDTVAPEGFRAFAGALGVVDLETPTEEIDPVVANLRIFAGYAGWGAGQLEEEIAEGSWYVVPGLPIDIFRPETGTLWRDVMRRQPGDLAWHSTRPLDPEMN